MPPPKEKPLTFRRARISQTVRRNLFGKLDQDDNAKLNEWLDKKDEEHATAKKEKYGFDFARGKKIEGILADFEIIMEDEEKVPVFYRARPAYKNRKAESLTKLRDHTVPSTSEPTMSTDSPSTGPTTRSAAKKLENSLGNLKQLKMTNYVRVRKRRSMDASFEKAAPPVKTKRMKNDAPASPYTYVSNEEDIEFPESPVKSANSSPVKKRSKSIAGQSSTAVRSLHVRDHTSV